MKVKNNIKSKRGFTIIEVVLVLAIAGLIFLMVFVALPALQRSQKDTQRRQDYAQLEAAITAYITNNGGKLPKDGANLDETQYLNSKGEDPDGVSYNLVVKDTGAAGYSLEVPDAAGEVFVYTHADCNGEDSTTGYAQPKANTSNRAFAIYGYLENGTYCQASK